MFSDYPNATGIPGSWSEWSGGFSGTRQSGEVGPYAYDVDAPTTADQGIQQGNIYSAPGWYVIEADAWLQSGTWSGACVLFWGATEGGKQIDCATDPDIGDFTGPLGPGVRRFRKLVQIANAEPKTLYCMTNYAAVSQKVAKRIRWYRVAVRPATEGEIKGRRADTNASSALVQIAVESAARAFETAALASRATVMEAALRPGAPNLVKNSDFSAAFTNWTGPTNQLVQYFHLSFGPIATWVGAPAGSYIYQDGPAQPGWTFTLSAEGDTGARGRIELQFLPAAQNQVLAATEVRPYSWDARTVSPTITAPAGTAYWRILVINDNGQDQSCTRIQLQRGAATAYRKDGDNYDLAARIAIEAAARATETAILAQQNTTLTGTVNGHTSALALQAGVLADVTGKFYSRYMVEANANGVITGIYAVASQGGGGVPVSGVKVRADTFGIVRSDDTATQYPFAYDATTGTLVLNQIMVQSANIGALAVKTFNLDGEAVTTEKLRANAITNSISVQAAIGGNINVAGEQLMSTGTIQTTGGRVEVLGALGIRATGNNVGEGALYDIKVYRDGSLILNLPNAMQSYNRAAGGFTLPVTDYPSPGTHTYEVRITRTASSGGGVERFYNYLRLDEIKR